MEAHEDVYISLKLCVNVEELVSTVNYMVVVSVGAASTPHHHASEANATYTKCGHNGPSPHLPKGQGTLKELSLFADITFKVAETVVR